MGKTWVTCRLISDRGSTCYFAVVCEIDLSLKEMLMFKPNVKTAAITTAALAAVLALGACGKKVGDTGTVPTPAPMTSPSTDSSNSSSGSSGGTGSYGSSSGSSISTSSNTMGTNTMGSGMPAPMTPASGIR